MLSIAITSFNRSDLTIESFSKVYTHELVDEIVIVDDASEESHWNRLLELIDAHPASQKINVFRNEKNLGMSLNKAEAVSKAKNEWVILFDSDNVLYSEYLDSIPHTIMNTHCGKVASFDSTTLNKNVIYHPIFAKPDYDFSKLPNYINKSNAKELLYIKEFRVMLNTCNFLVNRERYLEVYEYNPEIKESDSIWFNHLWLKWGYEFYLVPGMVYYHRRHAGSGWLTGDHSYNLKKAAELQEKIKQL